MKRTRNEPKHVDAILTADWHLREDQPVCRTDDFWAAQWDAVHQINILHHKYQCPVFHAGDLFNHWKPSPFMLSYTIERLPSIFYTIYGNHDLPQHNFELRFKSGVFTLEVANRLVVINGMHWGQPIPPRNELEFINHRSLLLAHLMLWQDQLPWPSCTDPSAQAFLNDYPEYDLILTGHNHKTFIAHNKGLLLVNPGSLTRQTADQIDHRPCVFLWDAEANEVYPHYLEIEQGVISREHIDRVQQRDERIAAFVERLNDEYQTSISFEENLQRFEQSNKIDKGVMDIVWRAV